MGLLGCRSRWTAVIVIVACSSMHVAVSAPAGSRNLNPYHKQQLEMQIRQCASAVVACTDADERSQKQQELCQLLIRAERYDDAIQVAYNIYQAEERQTERRAAYHFLVAEIYNRKMRAASSTQEMEDARKAALETAQQVLNQDYPAKWHVPQYARDLIKDLNDSSSMARVKQRLAQRQGSGDITREAIADAQRRYLDATQGGVSGGTPASQPRYVTAPSNPVTAPVDTVSAAAPVPGRSVVDTAPAATVSALPSEPQVTRVVSPLQRLTDGEQQALGRLGASGLLTSQPGIGNSQPGELVKTTVHTQQQPVLVNGQPAQGQHLSPEEIRQQNLAHLLESAKKRRQTERQSPYANGQLPELK